MRMYSKLFAVLFLTMLVQIAFESTAVVVTYPAKLGPNGFGEREAAAVFVAEREFASLSPFGRWVVRYLLAMPMDGRPRVAIGTLRLNRRTALCDGAVLRSFEPAAT